MVRFVTLGSVIPIVTPEEMGAIDAAAPEPVEELIDRAGQATARAALDMLGGTYGRVVNVLAGGGNNGNDGRTAGRYLERRGVKVRVIDAATRPPMLSPCDLVIDAAYGTGFRGDWTAPNVEATRGDRPLVLAVDIPSGVNALTGAAGPGVLAATAPRGGGRRRCVVADQVDRRSQVARRSPRGRGERGDARRRQAVRGGGGAVRSRPGHAVEPGDRSARAQ